MSDNLIDPVEYGKLLSKVDLMGERINSMDADIKALLELANKSKGGFWMGMAITSGVSGFVGFLASIFFHK
jgi:hypothetical protein